jgi:hypothetical protein
MPIWAHAHVPKWAFHVPVQEAPRGEQAIRDLRSPLTVVGLKPGEHEF